MKKWRIVLAAVALTGLSGSCLGADNEAIQQLLKRATVTRGFAWLDGAVFVVEEQLRGIRDVGLIVADADGRVVSSTILVKGGSSTPVARNSRYVSVGGFSGDSPPGYSIATYDNASKTFSAHNTGYVYLGFIFLNEHFLFYSSDKGYPNINRLDLDSGELSQYADRQLPNARFFLSRGDVVAVQPLMSPEHQYRIAESVIVEEPIQAESIPDGLTLDILQQESPPPYTSDALWFP